MCGMCQARTLESAHSRILPWRIRSPNVAIVCSQGVYGIDAVDVVEVDVVGLQPLQAGIDGAHQVAAREARVGDVGPHLLRALGGQHPAVALLLDGRADDLFGAAVGVDVGGVDEVDAALGRMVDDAPRLRLVGGAAEHHGAEAELRHLDAARAEEAVSHLGHGILLTLCHPVRAKREPGPSATTRAHWRSGSRIFADANPG